MFEVFKLYLGSKLTLSDSQFNRIIPHIMAKSVRRGDMVLGSGAASKHINFVEKGCLRSYVTDSKGKEHIIQFAPENWWIGDRNSAIKKLPAMFNIEAVEDSEILIMPGDIVDTLEEIVPGAAQMFAILNQNSMFAMQKRLINHLSATADERYLDFLETYPSLALRLPQKMIASYIGVAPESLSRIRSQIVVRR